VDYTRGHRSSTRRRGTRLAAGVAAAAALVLLTVLPACAAQAGSGAGGGTTGPGVAAGGASSAPGAVTPGKQTSTGGGDDWQHVLQAIANLRAGPPSEPLVVLLGGSAARESTIGDASWAAQVTQDGGPAVAAYNLGSRNRTLAQDVALVKKLPETRGIVYVGINVGRFTSPPSSPGIKLPEPSVSLPAYKQHQYSKTDIKSAAKKKALVTQWMASRYPAFKANYASNLKTLGALIAACRERGLEPVLLELPRDTAVIGGALDAPVDRFTADCKALARKKDVPWVSFVAKARLPDGDFYDLWHLVEPGREVWQTLLSKETVTLLKQYGMEGSGS
jgi:hypothetical protein